MGCEVVCWAEPYLLDSGIRLERKLSGSYYLLGWATPQSCNCNHRRRREHYTLLCLGGLRPLVLHTVAVRWTKMYCLCKLGVLRRLGIVAPGFSCSGVVPYGISCHPCACVESRLHTARYKCMTLNGSVIPDRQARGRPV